MYYPYLRGKQFELILLRDNAAFLKKNIIHPIIEPVKTNFSSLIRAMEALNDKDVNYTLIVNPCTGQKPVPTSSILDDLIRKKFDKCKNISLGYMLCAESDLGDLADHLRTYSAFNFSLLHYGYTDGQHIANTIKKYKNVKTNVFIEGYAGRLYRRHLKKDGIKRILIRDGFKSQRKNADYPSSEHFSDLHITFSDEGMDGFGDFLIVGDDYSESGGPAYAVAIHLTYLKADNDMYIYHFISDQTESQTNPGGKFLEALAKLVKEINKPHSLIYKSRACAEYVDLFKNKHFPGLGYVKKLSMQHHIELVASFLDRAE